uniref:Uncharacterized protein n=1 Tax=Arion vulgaris TaxID=1028688 RepID=A0A0B7B3U8_9EUPU
MFLYIGLLANTHIQHCYPMFLLVDSQRTFYMVNSQLVLDSMGARYYTSLTPASVI